MRHDPDAIAAAVERQVRANDPPPPAIVIRATPYLLD